MKDIISQMISLCISLSHFDYLSILIYMAWKKKSIDFSSGGIIFFLFEYRFYYVLKANLNVKIFDLATIADSTNERLIGLDCSGFSQCKNKIEFRSENSQLKDNQLSDRCRKHAYGACLAFGLLENFHSPNIIWRRSGLH